MQCSFAPTAEPNLYRCEHCGRQVRSQHRPERIHAHCRTCADPGCPTCKQRAEGEGRKAEKAVETRTGKEMARLAQEYCWLCEHFIAQPPGCKKCGCPANQSAAWQNKLRIGHCPLRKW